MRACRKRSLRHSLRGLHPPGIWASAALDLLALSTSDEHYSSLDTLTWGSGSPRAEEGAMLRNRFLILLGLCFLAASAAWADDVGYVDCSKNADGTQVFAKPRKSPDVVAAVPCGERFTVLVYGFVVPRIQTADGQVGYGWSSLIAIDRAATAAPQTPSLQTAAEKTKIPSTRAADTHAQTPGPAKTQTAAA